MERPKQDGCFLKVVHTVLSDVVRDLIFNEN